MNPKALGVLAADEASGGGGFGEERADEDGRRRRAAAALVGGGAGKPGEVASSVEEKGEGLRRSAKTESERVATVGVGEERGARRRRHGTPAKRVFEEGGAEGGGKS